MDYLGLIAALQMFLERLSARNSREAEVLQRVAEGPTKKTGRRNPGQQGQDLEKHRQPLMNKLDIHQTAGLSCYARVRGMIESRVRVTIL